MRELAIAGAEPLVRVRRLIGFIALLTALIGCAGGGSGSFVALESRPATVDWSSDGGLETLSLKFSRGAGDDVRMEVKHTKSVLTLTRRNGEWVASGVLSEGGWRGTWNTAPQKLGGWLCLAEAMDGAAHAPDGESEIRTGRMSVRYSKSGGVLRQIELAAVASDDRFRVRF